MQERNNMTTYSHSGTTGDTFSSLIVPKIKGGGELYLKLNNLENVVREKLGWTVTGRHAGRMTQDDYESMRELILHQPYISKFETWKGEHIDHELEDACLFLETNRFPRNFPNQHALANGIDLDDNFPELQLQPHMECREERKFPGRPIVIHRTPHYQEGNEAVSPTWKNLVSRQLSEQAVFIGLESEHALFEETYKCKVPHYKTADWMEVARVLKGAELFVCSMAAPCALALALGTTMMIETRKNEPFERLEVNYPFRLNVQYF
jgi:hypothetical protein